MKKRRVISIAAAVMLVVIGSGLYYVSQLIATGVAYKAKALCSGVFVSQRSPESVLNNDLAVDDLAVLRHIDANIDLATHTSVASFLGLIKQTAVFRPGLGCNLVFAGYGKTLSSPVNSLITSVNSKSGEWPETRADASARVDQQRLNSAVQWAYSEPDAKHQRRTRAVVIVHKGRIIAEQYAPGFDKNTPLAGWSMAKSVTNALVGILVGQGKISLADPVHITEWRGRNDGISAITLNNLLQMSSGLHFNEDSGDPLADVTHMLLRTPDMASYAAGKKRVAAAGTRWSYSSGATNLLSRLIRDVVGEADYLSFPRRALFEPLGMHSAVLEPDASGNFVASSFMYATARDWARFGQLYLQDGVWKGRRILPAGWVRYTTTPAEHAPDHQYGAHFWLKIPKAYVSGGPADPLPEDAFHAVGHEGQFVTVIPSRDLVLVRLGLSRYASAWEQDKFLGKVLEAFGNKHAP